MSFDKGYHRVSTRNMEKFQQRYGAYLTRIMAEFQKRSKELSGVSTKDMGEFRQGI